MMEKSNLPVRKPNRLQGYDYSTVGAYFVTLCAQNREPFFGKIMRNGTTVGVGLLDDPKVNLTQIGYIVEKHIKEMDEVYSHIRIDKYIIMPNHVHMIIVIANDNNGSSRTPTPTNATIPAFMSTLKRMTNKSSGFSLWQRSYHDHIIRDDWDYRRIWNYINNNPATWEKDRFYIKD